MTSHLKMESFTLRYNTMFKGIKEKNEKKKEEKEEKQRAKAEKKKKALKNQTTSAHAPHEAAEEVLPLQRFCLELVQREEKMMTRGGLSEEDQTQLGEDLGQLWTQIRDEVQKTFSPDFDEAGLRAAVFCILQQEAMDQRWTSLDSDLVPAWRPNKSLQGHNELLWNTVQERLSPRPLQNGAEDESKSAAESAATESGETSDQDSAAVTQEIDRLTDQMRNDLSYIQMKVSPCYPGDMDILNTYLRLYHRCISAHLQQLANAPLDYSALFYLLSWANHRYPRDVLVPDLEGKVDSESLDPLLPSDLLLKLTEKYLKNIQSITEERLQRTLKLEESSWVTQTNVKQDEPDSPLATDVIQLLTVSLLNLRCVGPEQSLAVTAHLDPFLCSYVQAVKKFAKGNHTNVESVLIVQLMCEEKFRKFVLQQEMDEQTRQSCLKSLDTLRDCGYCSLTRGIRSKLKEQVRGLWTAQWMDGSLPLIDALLDFLNQKLKPLTDLKSSWTQWVLERLHRDVALHYFKKLVKTRRRSQEEQVGGANRMKDDVAKMDDFFTEYGSSSQWISQLLLHVVEILRLQDPDSVQLEVVYLVQLCPDLSLAHVSRLLLVKSGLSVRSVRSIKRSVEENRPPELSSNQRFFSHLKVKCIEMEMSDLETGRCHCCVWPNWLKRIHCCAAVSP